MPKSNFITKIHPNTMAIYQAMNEVIRIKRYRQEDLAKVLHVSQGTISYHLKNYSFDQDQLNTHLDFLRLEICVRVKEY